MIKPDRQLVRRLRRRVRQKVNADPALRRERRRVQRSWTRQLTAASLRFAVPLMVVGGTAADAPHTLIMPALAVWTLAVTLFRAAQIIGALRGPALAVYYPLPVTDAAVFRHQCTLLVRSSAWLALDWLAFGLVAALQGSGGVNWFAALLFAVGQAVTALATAWFLAAWRPRLPFGPIAILLVASLWLFAQVGRGGAAAALVAPLVRAFLTFTPGGWLVLAQENVLAGGWWGWLVGLGLTAASSVALQREVNRESTTFALDAIVGDRAAAAPKAPAVQAPHDEPDAEAPFAGHEASDSNRQTTAGPAPMGRAVAGLDLRGRVEEALTTPPGLALFQRGWLESRVTRMLSIEQRMLVDFLQPQSPRWGKLWLIALGLILLAAFVRAAGYNADWLAWLPGVALGLFALPTFGGSWMGLQAMISSNGQIGLHAFVPVGFFQLARTMLTVNGLRCMVALPLIVLAVHFGFTPAPLPWGATMRATLNVLVIILTLLPTWTVIGFSKTTNDTSSRWWIRLVLIGLLVVGFFVGVSLGMALFLVENPVTLAGCMLVMLVFSYGLLGLYGWAWGRGTFDLIGKVPR